MAGVRLLTGPMGEPVTVEEARAAVNYDKPDQDELFTLLIASARERAEQFTGRAFGLQTWEYGLDRATTTIELPLPPLVGVTKVEYYSEADPGTAVVVPAEDYQVDTWSTPGRVHVDMADWPTLRTVVPVVVTFEAGIDPPEATPASVRQAILELVRDGWIRETNQTGMIPSMANQVPPRVTDLLYPWIVRYRPVLTGVR
jgi:uncharacterized phiE125 gp8 family phage protein